jgi:hypothetical protein
MAAAPSIAASAATLAKAEGRERLALPRESREPFAANDFAKFGLLTGLVKFQWLATAVANFHPDHV